MPGGESVLQWSMTMQKSGPVLVLSGEADVRSAGRLRELLVARMWRCGPRLVIDVSGLRHVDSESTRVLVVAAKMLRQQGAELVLLRPQASVARVLDLMGADEVITIAEPPAALAARSGPGDRCGRSA